MNCLKSRAHYDEIKAREQWDEEQKAKHEAWKNMSPEERDRERCKTKNVLQLLTLASMISGISPDAVLDEAFEEFEEEKNG